VIAVDPHVGGSTMPVVDSQNLEGANRVTRHLIELGHRRIGFLGGRPDLESARQREEGFRAALAEAGIDFDPGLFRVGGFLAETASGPARELLSLPDRPTAVVAANDRSAIEVMRIAAELGLSVPGDVSIVGFDNIPESALVDPPLTTVDQSIQSLGYEAVRLLLDFIEHPERHVGEEPIHIRLPTELVVRRSTGPVGAAPAVDGGRGLPIEPSD
jgi:LacI family transcriptional regulator